MTRITFRRVEYGDPETRLIGGVATPVEGPGLTEGTPAVLLVHDAFGVSEGMLENARRLAAEGYPVFVADIWGNGRVPADDAEVGPLIGGMAGDRPRWISRVAAAHDALAAQPELSGRPVVLLGYCFGGSSALEYLRTGARVAGLVAIHPGLDLLDPDWSSPGAARVLVCVGAEDPMATAGMLADLQSSLDGAGLDWQTHLYSGTKHAFTSPMAEHSPMPDVIAYNPRSADRAWAATLRFLHEFTENPREATP